MFSTYLSLNRKKIVSKVFNVEGRFFAWNCIFLIENTSDREENCAINESKSAPVYRVSGFEIVYFESLYLQKYKFFLTH